MATPTTLPATFTAGQVLTAAQLNDLRGAFRTLQVVSAAYSTQTGSTSGTYATTGLSAIITPQSSSNTILVNVSMSIGMSADPNNITGFRIIRTTSAVDTTVGTWNYAFGPRGSSDQYGSWSHMLVVSPATTSATTFTVQFARFSGGGTVYAQSASSQSTIVLQEISA